VNLHQMSANQYAPTRAHSSRGGVIRKRKRGRGQQITRDEHARARKATKTRKKKGIAAAAGNRVYESPVSRIMGALNADISDALEPESRLGLGTTERAATIENMYMMTENTKILDEYAEHDAEYGAPRKDKRSGFDMVRIPDKASDIAKYDRALQKLTAKHKKNRQKLLRLHKKASEKAGGEILRQACPRNQLRLPIPDNYTQWSATKNLPPECSLLPTLDNVRDPALLITGFARMTLENSQPYCDFEVEIQTAKLAFTETGDTTLLLITAERCHEFEQMGFVQGALDRNRLNGPDPRYKTHFFIIGGVDRFGLYLFTSAETCLLQYYIWVEQRRRA
jgi:hypothetical protein